MCIWHFAHLVAWQASLGVLNSAEENLGFLTFLYICPISKQKLLEFIIICYDCLVPIEI